MSSFAEASPARFDGQTAAALADRLSLPHVALFDSVSSTLTVAHAMAANAPSGTLVIADEQTAGRGRLGRAWSSAAGTGLWITMIERPTDARALEVLALRCGLYAAEALEPLSFGPIAVKWPNDLYVNERKLAGILIETRWRGTAPEWVAIGFGLNVHAPAVESGVGLRAPANRLQALDLLVPALRRAASASRYLSDDELRRWSGRDIAVGREVAAPGKGTVQGISSEGELLIANSSGDVTAYRSGSLTFATPPACS